MIKKFAKTTAIIGALIVMLGVTTPIYAASCEKGTVTASSLNVRSGASTSYKKIGSLKKGNTVTIYDTKNGWYKIKYNGKNGWVSKQYVSTKTASSTTKTEKGTVTANSLNVRSGASTSYKKIGSLKKGSQVTIYDTKNGWYKIKYNGTYGWVSKQYVSTKTSSSSKNTVKGYTVKKSLNVRAVAYTGGQYTALGTKVRYGVIAVDPKVIPYRTKVYIKELDKVFVAEDCGGGIKGNIIDIYMDTLSQCRNWGSRNITIQILE
ncbi:MAG: SH3 domain-containing protein [Intestinibacter sp.]